MTPSEYLQLEALLAKVGTEIGGHRFCILSGIGNDGYEIGRYDNDGKLIKYSVGPTIEQTIAKYKKS